MADIRPTFNPSQQMFYNDFEIYKYYKENREENQEPLHHHDFYEIFFFLEGNQRYIIEDKIYNLIAGDILLISPSELHQSKVNLSDEVSAHIILWINKKFLERMSTPEANFTSCFNLSQNHGSNLIRADAKKIEYITTLANFMIDESKSDDAFSYKASKSYLILLLSYINRLASSDDSFTFINYQENKLISDVMAYIHENFDKNISLESIASTFFVSKYHLSRTFQKHMDTGLHKYITSKRLQRAKEILSTTPTKEVYKLCGFGDYTSFYRAFKNTYDISPNEYAKQFRGGFSKPLDKKT